MVPAWHIQGISKHDDLPVDLRSKLKPKRKPARGKLVHMLGDKVYPSGKAVVKARRAQTKRDYAQMSESELIDLAHPDTDDAKAIAELEWREYVVERELIDQGFKLAGKPMTRPTSSKGRSRPKLKAKRKPAKPAKKIGGWKKKLAQEARVAPLKELIRHAGSRGLTRGPARDELERRGYTEDDFGSGDWAKPRAKPKAKAKPAKKKTQKGLTKAEVFKMGSGELCSIGDKECRAELRRRGRDPDTGKKVR